MVETRKPII